MKIQPIGNASHELAGGRVEALTGLRFVAAFMALLGHGYPILRFEDNAILGLLLGPLAGFAMSVFFVLSGVVLWLNYASSFQRQPFGTTFWQFCVARSARLYPLLLVVVLVGFVAAPRGAFSGALPEALMLFTGLHAWVPGQGNAPLMMVVPHLGHAWSISAEIFLYLCFPFMVLALRRVSTPQAQLVLLAGTIMALATLLWAVRFPQVVQAIAPGLPVEPGRHWFVFYLPYVRLPEFLAGCLVAMLATGATRTPRPRSAWGRRALLIGAAIVAAWTVWGYIWFDSARFASWRALFVVAVCVFIHDLMRHDSFLRRALSTRSMLWGGERSYSIYLLHPMLLMLFVTPPEPELTFAGLLRFSLVLGVAIAMILVFSAGSYAVIEVPARAWLRRALTGPSRWRALGTGGGLLAAAVAFCALALPILAFPHRAPRLTDIAALEAALAAHRKSRGTYPVTEGFVGAHWAGATRGDWLPGLVPDSLARLPKDPRNTEIEAAQYVYRSDGTDYKWLALNPEDCRVTLFFAPRFSDPVRNINGGCLAYGVWTPGAIQW